MEASHSFSLFSRFSPYFPTQEDLSNFFYSPQVFCLSLPLARRQGLSTTDQLIVDVTSCIHDRSFLNYLGRNAGLIPSMAFTNCHDQGSNPKPSDESADT